MHEPESRVRSRDFPMHIQEIFYDIIKHYFRTNPGNLWERFEEEMTRAYGESEAKAHTEGITLNQLSVFLKREMRRATADNFKEYIGCLHEFIKSTREKKIIKSNTAFPF